MYTWIQSNFALFSTQICICIFWFEWGFPPFPPFYPPLVSSIFSSVEESICWPVVGLVVQSRLAPTRSLIVTNLRLSERRSGSTSTSEDRLLVISDSPGTGTYTYIPTGTLILKLRQLGFLFTWIIHYVYLHYIPTHPPALFTTFSFYRYLFYVFILFFSKNWDSIGFRSDLCDGKL